MSRAEQRRKQREQKKADKQMNAVLRQAGFPEFQLPPAPMRTGINRTTCDNYNKRQIRACKRNYRYCRRKIYHQRYFSANVKTRRTETDAGISKRLHH